MNIHDSLNTFASLISSYRPGLAYHLPETWAQAGYCYENVCQKVQQDGGRARFGWTFCYRILEDLPDLGYLMATHHAVWNSPDGKLVDITPFHDDKKHQPYALQGDILFLVDDQAEPVMIGNMIAPLPLRFFPLSNDMRLINHIERLRSEEEQKCHAIYQGKLEGTKYRLVSKESL